MKQWASDAVQSMSGRNRIVHVVLWFVYCGIALEIVQTKVGTTSLVLMPIQLLMFGLHELSHVATGFLPEAMTASAGSLSELLFAGLLVMIAYKKRAYITTFFMGLWWLYAAFSVGRYMADARSQSMPLVSIDSAINEQSVATHDWHFVFSELDILNADTFIGNIVKATGIIVALTGIIFYAYLIITKRKITADLPVANKVQGTSSSVAEVVYSSDPIDKSTR